MLAPDNVHGVLFKGWLSRFKIHFLGKYAIEMLTGNAVEGL